MILGANFTNISIDYPRLALVLIVIIFIIWVVRKKAK